jgi:hypothetical protein
LTKRLGKATIQGEKVSMSLEESAGSKEAPTRLEDAARKNADALFMFVS